jgi:hypothetical protein
MQAIPLDSVIGALFPAVGDLVDAVADVGAGVVSGPAITQQLVVVGFAVANVGDNGEVDGVFVERLGCSGTANAAAVFSAGMFGNV